MDSVAEYVFKRNQTITSVIIGENIKTIGKAAFYGAKNLKNIYIYSKHISTIGKKAFYGIAKDAVFHIKATLSIRKAVVEQIINAGYKGIIKYKKLQ